MHNFVYSTYLIGIGVVITCAHSKFQHPNECSAAHERCQDNPVEVDMDFDNDYWRDVFKSNFIPETNLNHNGLDSFPEYTSPSWLTTPPGMGMYNYCFFRDNCNSSYICDSLDLVDFKGMFIPEKLQYLKINGTGIENIPKDVLKNHTIQVIIIKDNVRMNRISWQAFRGVEGLKYLYIQGNGMVMWPRMEDSFFYMFRNATELRHLVLESNNITFKGMKTAGSAAILPCLEYLSLRGNNIRILDSDVFQPFRCSPLRELNLQNCQLEFIHEDTFLPLRDLEHVDLYYNPKLFQPGTHTCKLPISAALASLQENHKFANLGFAKNSLATVPTQTLENVRKSLRRLNLAHNYFNEMGSTGGNQANLSFPIMPHLEDLILDHCDIRTIAVDTFANLPNLKQLSLKSNPLHTFSPALIISPLEVLHLYVEDEFEEDYKESFNFPSRMFENNAMKNLKILQIHNAHFGDLEDYHFKGLDNLEVLSLESSSFGHFSDMLFGNLSSLTNLSLAYCESEDPIHLKKLKGLSKLINLDLTYASLNLSLGNQKRSEYPAHEGEFLLETEMNPLFPLMHSIKILNLTRSLIEIDNPLENLFLELISNLTVLEIGENKIRSWNKTLFNQNGKLEMFTMARNGLDIILTEEMLYDFFNNTQLKLLDLSENSFICSDEIGTFFRLAMHNTNITIEGYFNGSGYTCIDLDDDGKDISFIDYATKGFEIRDGIIVKHQYLIYLIIGICTGVVMSVVIVVSVYKKRWYIRYHYLLRKEIRREEPFQFDAFLSYSQHNEKWVNSYLIPYLEDVEPRMNICFHERDFKVGKSVVENIVDSIDTSRKCLIVLSAEYADSSWCMFEAHLANHRLVQENRQSLAVIKLEDFDENILSKEMQYLLKSITYLPWPKLESEEQEFWQKLKVTLAKKSSSYSNIAAIEELL